MANKYVTFDPQTVLTEDIFVSMGLQDASSETKNMLMDTMLETVETRVWSRIFEALNEEDQKLLLEKVDQDQEFESLLKERSINLQDIVSEEFMRYKTEIVEIMANATIKTEE